MRKRQEKAIASLVAWGVIIYLSVSLYEAAVPWFPLFLDVVTWVGCIVVAWWVARALWPRVAKQLAEQKMLIDGYRHDFGGVEYENFCAALLRKAGWSVETTPATGDHGADLLIRKGQASAAIQCKHYSQPVGVKAVQEALAARTYYGTEAAFVVANTGFTPNAVALAQRAEVQLLHHSRLADLERLMPSTKGWWDVRRREG